MISANQRKSESTGAQEFQHSLRLVDAITSWHLWGSALMILLLPGTIILLSFPLLFARLGLFHERYASLAVQGLLGMMWVVSGFTLYHQRSRLKMLRTGLIGQMDGATKNHVRAEKFYGLSILDPLTGLYNRRFGETRLEEEISSVEESDDPLLLLALDFDRFKEINDKYGHAAGDLALKEFSRRLQRAIRACDVPIRVGGDEFLVIFPECQPDKIQAILSRMGSIVLKFDGKQIPLSFSHGLVQYQVNDTPETMIKRADERLYAQKAKRKTDVGVDQTNTTKSVTQKKDSESSSGEPPDSQPVAGMRLQRVRRSGRFPKKIAVFLIGSDLDGTVFSEQTNTVELSRHGAGVVSRHKLAPEQHIIIRCQETNREAEARVVRVIGSQSDSHTYGLEFVGSTIDIWDVEVPPLTESEKEAHHSLFQCSDCEGRETLNPSDVELNGYAVNKAVVRPCKRCGSATTWTRVLGDEVGALPQTVTA